MISSPRLVLEQRSSAHNEVYFGIMLVFVVTAGDIYHAKGFTNLCLISYRCGRQVTGNRTSQSTCNVVTGYRKKYINIYIY